MNKQHLVGPPVNKYDDSSGQLRPNLFATACAALGNIGMQFHRASANTAEASVLVPVKYLLALSGFQIQFGGKFVERRS